MRPGPLGTLDLYVFTDGTTLCLTPGHRETAEQLAGALERGEAPVLLGGSGVSGAYALTFTYGTRASSSWPTGSSPRSDPPWADTVLRRLTGSG